MDSVDGESRVFQDYDLFSKEIQVIIQLRKGKGYNTYEVLVAGCLDMPAQRYTFIIPLSKKNRKVLSCTISIFFSNIGCFINNLKGCNMSLSISRFHCIGRYLANRIGSLGARGFSLIELLIVMIILGLLASLVGPKMFGKLGMAKQKTAKTQIEMLLTALDAYRLDMGVYPSTQEGLEALMVNPGSDNWDGPYLAKELPLDPWGNPYNYENPGTHGEVDIYSYGLDNQPGGEGENSDVGSW